MPERPHPDLDRVRAAMTERDENERGQAPVPEGRDEPQEQEPGPDEGDDADA